MPCERPNQTFLSMCRSRVHYDIQGHASDNGSWPSWWGGIVNPWKHWTAKFIQVENASKKETVTGYTGAIKVQWNWGSCIDE